MIGIYYCASLNTMAVIPPLLNNITQGGGGRGSETIRSQLRALATHTPSLGRVGQGAWM